jgi:hypothetical protein
MKETRKYLVFLDIDGVFTSSRVHFAHAAAYEMWHRFDPVAVDFMNKIHDRYPVEFVIMSTWKDNLRSDDNNVKHWVHAAFGNSGFRGQLATPWKTDPDNVIWQRKGANDRAYEVKEYLELYATDIKDYILFDDNRYQFKEVLGVNRLVHTDHENGLLYKHMLNAHSLMGQWHER